MHATVGKEIFVGGYEMVFKRYKRCVSRSRLLLVDFLLRRSSRNLTLKPCTNFLARPTQLFATGQCGCLGYDLTQGDDWKTIYYNSSLDFDAVISDYDDTTKRETVAAVCTSTIFDGDHLQVCVRVFIACVRKQRD